MKLYVVVDGKQQAVYVPDSKKSVAYVSQVLKKTLKLDEFKLYVDGKLLQDKDSINDGMKIEVKVPAPEGMKEGEEEQYEVEYEQEETSAYGSSDYEPGDSDYSD